MFKQGRWTAVGASSIAIGLATALLYLSLSRTITRSSTLRFVPVLALVLLAATPFIAARLSGRAAPFVAGAGGLALGIAAIVMTAALHPGGTGSFPLTTGIAVAGAVALSGPSRVIPARVIATVVLMAYALLSGRLISAAFVYPMLGLSDEIAELLDSRRGGDQQPKQPARTTN